MEVSPEDKVRAPSHIRGLDPKLYRQFRIEALRRGKTIGELLNELLAQWLTSQTAGEERR